MSPGWYDLSNPYLEVKTNRLKVRYVNLNLTDCEEPTDGYNILNLTRKDVIFIFPIFEVQSPV